LPQDKEEAKDHCYGLAHAASELAGWLLTKETLERAAQYAEEMLNNPQEAKDRLRPVPVPDPKWAQTCVVAVQSDPSKYPLLKPAFAIPVRWDLTANAPEFYDDLPKHLQRRAQALLRNLDENSNSSSSQNRKAGSKEWRLRLGLPDFENYFFDFEIFQGDSADASLMASWILAKSKGKGKVTVWASACFDGGFKPVDKVEEKIQCGQSHGAKTFFVAATQNVSKYIEGVTVAKLNNDSIYPIPSLRPLLREIIVPPDDYEKYSNENPNGRSAFYEDATGYRKLLEKELADPLESSRFYSRKVLPHLAREIRENLQNDPQKQSLLGSFLTDNYALITIFSGSPELIELALKVFVPKFCLILYTQSNEAKLKGYLENHQDQFQQTHIDKFIIEEEQAEGQLLKLPVDVKEWVNQHAACRMIVDLTPGTKLMTLTLKQELVDQMGCCGIYWDKKQDGPIIRHGTEKLLVIPNVAQPK
jgi:hypothetical protein